MLPGVLAQEQALIPQQAVQQEQAVGTFVQQGNALAPSDFLQLIWQCTRALGDGVDLNGAPYFRVYEFDLITPACDGPIETLAYVSPRGSYDLDEQLRRVFDDAVQAAVFNHPYTSKRFDLLERNRIELVLKEHGLVSSQGIDPRNAPGLGKLLLRGRPRLERGVRLERGHHGRAIAGEPGALRPAQPGVASAVSYATRGAGTGGEQALAQAADRLAQEIARQWTIQFSAATRQVTFKVERLRRGGSRFTLAETLAAIPGVIRVDSHGYDEPAAPRPSWRRWTCRPTPAPWRSSWLEGGVAAARFLRGPAVVLAVLRE